MNIDVRHASQFSMQSMAFDEVPSLQQQTWAAIGDLDSLFQNTYTYFHEKGFQCMMLTRITDLCILVFTIFLSTFLGLFIDWSTLLDCTGDDQSEHGCSTIHVVTLKYLKSPSFGHVVVMLYFVIFSLYLLWNVASFVSQMHMAQEMRAFFNSELSVTDEQLQTMPWHDLVQRLVDLQETRKLCLVRDLDALDIANRIMRRENYMIGLMASGVLDLGLPVAQFWTYMGAHLRAALADSTGDGAMGKWLEFNLRKLCLEPFMFDHEQFAISAEFLDNPDALAKRFRVVGIANLCLMPFTLLFMCVFFFLKYAEEIHSKKNVMGPRQWTPLARWKFREFNELPHLFEERLAATHEHGTKFLSLFPFKAQSIVAQFVSYLMGSLVAILLLITLLNSPVMTHFTVAGQTLSWYLAVFSALLAVSRAFVEPERGSSEPEQTMREIAAFTHYFPDRWKGNCHTYDVLEEFKKLYAPRTLIFLLEILSILKTPFVLCFSLPPCAHDIVGFVRKYSSTVPGVGAVCSFAQFDFGRCADRAYSGVLAPSAMRRAIVTEAGSEEENVSEEEKEEAELLGGRNPVSSGRPRMNGKMEKSFLNFALNNPAWEGSEAGTELLNNVLGGSALVTDNLGPNIIHSVETDMTESSTFHESAQMLHDLDEKLPDDPLLSAEAPYVIREPSISRRESISSSTRHLACSFSALLNMSASQIPLDNAQRTQMNANLFSQMEQFRDMALGNSKQSKWFGLSSGMLRHASPIQAGQSHMYLSPGDRSFIPNVQSHNMFYGQSPVPRTQPFINQSPPHPRHVHSPPLPSSIASEGGRRLSQPSTGHVSRDLLPDSSGTSSSDSNASPPSENILPRLVVPFQGAFMRSPRDTRHGELIDIPTMRPKQDSEDNSVGDL
eukprot:106874_1